MADLPTESPTLEYGVRFHTGTIFPMQSRREAENVRSGTVVVREITSWRELNDDE